jgi:exonuclease SbcC
MEIETNKCLKILTNDNITVQFITEDVNKSGNTVDTLDILVNYNGTIRPYESFSGGEKMRIDFACHVGMSKFLCQKAGINIDTFFVDEGLGALDAEGKSSLIDMINKLSLIFSKVIVISHIDDIKESFNNKVLIYRDENNYSRIKILN